MYVRQTALDYFFGTHGFSGYGLFDLKKVMSDWLLKKKFSVTLRDPFEV